jgi:hypothetical protein
VQPSCPSGPYLPIVEWVYCRLAWDWDIWKQIYGGGFRSCIRFHLDGGMTEEQGDLYVHLHWQRDGRCHVYCGKEFHYCGPACGRIGNRACAESPATSTPN